VASRILDVVQHRLRPRWRHAINLASPASLISIRQVVNTHHAYDIARGGGSASAEFDEVDSADEFPESRDAVPVSAVGFVLRC
jgi:hypothetical protein